MGTGTYALQLLLILSEVSRPTGNAADDFSFEMGTFQTDNATIPVPDDRIGLCQCCYFALDDALSATLERAAPIYRRVWWPTHVVANRTWSSATQALVDRHGAEVVAYVTRAYGAKWPASGYAVHVSCYANAGSAYSSGITGMIVAPSRSEFTAGLYALEAIVHEAMHQWDGQTYSAMRAAAPDARIPLDLSHALIFYTSGAAVTHAEPKFVPVADAFDIWSLGLSGSTLPTSRLKPLLVEIWQPWLDGRGTRDDALAALVTRASAVSQP